MLCEMGLSPRVRGNQASVTVIELPVGSIPACAGEPVVATQDQPGGGVYPRVCGGTDNHSFHLLSVQGLSPRVRGNRVLVLHDLDAEGSIPACAGEPGPVAGYRCHGRVYPRVCGGTSLPLPHPKRWRGLSPRVRGNQRQFQPAGHNRRSIPACAGEPPAVLARTWRTWVYPRVCGGTSKTTGGPSSEPGLSPRVRGNPSLAAPAGCWRRSIPACAGEPAGARHSRQHTGVYPRVCGGTLTVLLLALVAIGLSPRVRGNRQVLRSRVASAGSIPACAGNP